MDAKRKKTRKRDDSMVLYSVIMFLIAALMGGMGIAIYRGKTDLIHDYHQTKVTDKAAYGKAFGKAMLVLAMTLFLSGVVGLLGDSDTVAAIAVGVLVVGLFIGMACIIAVQKKYNSGVF